MRFLPALLSLSAFAGELTITRVIGPEVKTGPYKHPASICELANGDLYLVYYGGEGEYAVSTNVFGMRLTKGASEWTPPRVIAHDPFRSVGNGVIWQAPDGKVWLFYVVRHGDTWSTSRIQAKISTDGAESWSDSFVVSETPGMMVRNHPIVLTGGDYLIPVYHETGHDTEMVGPGSTSRFLTFSPSSRRWTELGAIRSAKGNIQPGVVELSPGYLLAYCRRGGGYNPVKDGYIVKSESRDGGRTWSEGRDSQFENPNSAIELLKLRGGALLLIYNPSMNERTPLTAALSADGGNTWPWRRNIAGGRNSFAYPSAVQGADGRVHLVYTSNQRTIIFHAVLDEDWVKQGKH
jgi:predicted neuraminidase